MNQASRRTLWLVAAIGSFLMVVCLVTLTHGGNHSLQAYSSDFIDRVWRPTFLSFFTICAIGLVYEAVMKSSDESGQEDLIARAVRSAIFGRNSEAMHSDAALSDQQNEIKEQLIQCTNDIHNKRLIQLERDHVLEIHEFGRIWEVLIGKTFDTGETLYDYTIGTNAMLRFQAYQFSNYYSNLFLRRSSVRSSRSKVKILIFCDYEHNTAGAAERMEAASKELEGAVKRVLERIQTANRMEKDLLPGDVYKQASNDGNAVYEFRLVSAKHISTNEKIAFETPFNIYGNLALSQSFVAGTSAGENQPIPHLAVSLKAESIDQFRKQFGSVWDRALFSVTKFSETMTSWEDFGTGKLLKSWAEID